MNTLGVATLLALLGLSLGASINATAEVTCDWNECDKPCGEGVRTCERSNGKTWNHACHVQDCQKPDKCGNADVVFVVDASTSIGEKNWWKTKQFMIDVSKGLTISQTETRVAVVIYSTSGYTMWNLTDHDNIDDLEDDIWDIEFIKGNTNTYEGLLLAEQALDNAAREGLKNIVIVITDGKANVKASKLQPQADKMHAQGIEMFAVGVGNDVDTVEIDGMASEPKNVHARYISDYDALVAITNSIISDTCEAAGGVECGPWSVWSKCVYLEASASCGTGFQSRMRTCKFTNVGSVNEEIRVQTEHRLCNNMCDSCASCEYNVHGVGYAPHDNCRQFIQCEYVDGAFIEHVQNCGELFWRQSILSCDTEHDTNYTCKDEPVIDSPTVTVGPVSCPDMEAHDDPSKYVRIVNGVRYVMPCAPGTIFNLDSCSCIHGGVVPTCDNLGTVFAFPFNTDTNDVCQRTTGVIRGNVTLNDDAAYFDGESFVEIGFLKNWFAEKDVTALTLNLWFKYTGNDGLYRGMFSNGDCLDDASLLLAIGDGVARGQMIARETVNFDSSAVTMSINRDQWIMATLVYSGWDAKYYLNGKQVASVSLDGNVANTQCAATVGFDRTDDLPHFFEGYIDDVRMYEKTLYEFDINQLFDSGRM